VKDIRWGRGLLAITLFWEAEKEDISLQNAYFWDINAK
jgi:hypothetical protein